MGCGRKIGPFDCCSVVQGDCLELMRLLPDGCVDAVITDPPYSDRTHSGARTRNAADNTTDNVLIPFSAMDYEDICKAFSLMSQKVSGWVISFMDWRYLADLERTPPTGLNFIRFGVWVKPNGAPQFTGDRPATGWEAIAMLHSDDVPMTWNGGGKRAVFNTPAVHGEHPTQKPKELLTDLVWLFSDYKSLVLDPFAGSGTTLLAAHGWGRHFLGFEISPDYCEIARKRIAAVEAQPTLFAPKPEQMTLGASE